MEGWQHLLDCRYCFPFWEPSFTFGGPKSLRAVIFWFTDMAGDIPFLRYKLRNSQVEEMRRARKAWEKGTNFHALSKCHSSRLSIHQPGTCSPTWKLPKPSASGFLWQLHYAFMSDHIIIVNSEVAQLCPTLCDPMDCSLPGSSVHGIFQAIVLEWIATSFSRGSSRHRDRTRIFHIVDRRFTI